MRTSPSGLDDDPALSGPWRLPEVAAFLAEARLPVRLSAIGPSGYPMTVSLWYLGEAGALYCATRAASPLVGALRRNTRCSFEVAADAPPYKGVRGQGDARLADDGERALLRRLIHRYLGDASSPLARWLLEREGDECAIVVRPHRLMSWDYSDRMSGIANRG